MGTVVGESSPLSSSSSSHPPAKTLTRVINEEIGLGRFQYLLILLCGWANASEAVEILSVSFIITEVELGSLEGWLGSVVFLGMMVGGPGAGFLADRRGRKPVLVLSLSLVFLAGLLSAAASSAPWLVHHRFWCGVGVGACTSVVWTYAVEFLPTVGRGRCLSVLAAFWMVGAILTASLAWAVIPRGVVTLMGREVAAWRLFMVLCAVPSGLAIVAQAIAPESPRWLLLRGRKDEAAAVVALMARLNGRSAPDLSDLAGESPSAPLLLDDGASEGALVSLSSSSSPSPSSSLAMLFRRPQLRRTLLLILVWFTLSFGYYGLTLYTPTYFKRLPPSELSRYAAAMIVALAQIPGNVLSILMMDRYPRGRVIGFCLALSSLAIGGVSMVRHGDHALVLLCAFAGLTVGAWNSLDIVSAELVPVGCRGLGYGILTAAARIAALSSVHIFAEFSENKPAVPLLIVVTMFATGAVGAWLLPRTNGVDVD
jgi:VNT family MFS transporter (synaptic vesicle glycoprotein 2)